MELTVCEIYSQYYSKKGLIVQNKTQQVENTKFYASEYFSPIDFYLSTLLLPTYHDHILSKH